MNVKENTAPGCGKDSSMFSTACQQVRLYPTFLYNISNVKCIVAWTNKVYCQLLCNLLLFDLAAIIEDAIFCTHGGLSPDLYNPDLVSYS